MTKKEYKQLVKSTYSFTQMDADRQKEILNAKGQEMVSVVKSIKQENEAMTNIVAYLDKKAEKIIFDFKSLAKATEHNEQLAIEGKARTGDQKILKNLINKI